MSLVLFRNHYPLTDSNIRLVRSTSPGQLSTTPPAEVKLSEKGFLWFMVFIWMSR
jgi:hypothetical protein